ncbi:MAG: hypothetical protein KDA91_19360 [Planctomycetaceae bacterium]|nr:hypothetical protein [Planctomycetaceae bacterium]
MTTDPLGISNYATHLPMLRFLLSLLRPARILEFGVGHYSTGLFRASPAHVCSVESNAEWAKQFVSSDPRHTVIHWPDEAVQDCLLDDSVGEVDLALVDGPVHSRVPCVERLFWKSRVIVIHDSLTRCYEWRTLHVPARMHRLDDTRLHPATSVFAYLNQDVRSIGRYVRCTSLAARRRKE